MTRAVRFITASLLLASSLPAQTTSDIQPVVRGEPVVVESTRLAADAIGTTRLQLDDTLPAVTLSPADVFGRIANLNIDSGGAGSFGDLLTLRGMSNTPYFSDPAVTVYFDDIPLGNVFSYPTTLFGFSNVTVYRGPQATTFGRAGEAGVIVFSSTGAGSLAADEARASFGNFNAYSAAVTANGSLGQFGGALSAAYSSRDGYVRNTQLGTRVDDSRLGSLSARVQMRATRVAVLSLQVLGNRVRNGAQPLVPLGGPLFTVSRSREGQTDSDFVGAALKAVVDTGAGLLTATTSYTNWKLDPYSNELVLPPTLDSNLAQSQRIWNEEIRMGSARNAALPWNLGLWWSDAHTAGSVNRAIPNVAPIEASSFTQDARTIAVFGDALALGSEYSRITVGLRAEQVHKDFARAEQVPGNAQYAAERTFKALLPRVTANLTMTRDTTATISLSMGTRPGGWSAYTAYPSLARFKAEQTYALEAGTDTSFAHHTFTLAVRGFAYDIRDYQIERSFTAVDYMVVNAPKARSVGGEVEATWRVSPALTLTGSLGVTKVTLREFTDPFTGENFAGRRAPYVPWFDANLSATYRIGAGWFASAEWAITGRTYYDEANTLAFAQRQRDLVNARLGYETHGWRLELFGENLANKQYYSLIIPGVGHGVPGAPRTYGVEATYRW